MTRPHIPRSVLAATVAIGCLVPLWVVAVPAYRVVDEPQWLSTAVRLAEGHGYPPPGHARLERSVVATYPWAGFSGSDARTFVPQRKAPSHPPGWPSLRALNAAPTDPDQLRRPDQMTQHPPLWALLAAAEIRTFHLLDAPADTAITVLRLLQGLLLLPLPWLVWLTARRIGASPRAAAAAAWAPVSVPQLLHVGSGISNTALLVAEVGAVTPLLAAAADGDRRRRLGVAIGALFGVAMLTKLFGILLLPWIAVAYLAGSHGNIRAATRPALLATGTAIGTAGWWYALTFAQHGTIQPSGYPPEIEARFAMDMPLGHAVRRFGTLLLRSSWNDLGWFETPSRMWVCLAIALLVLAPLTAVVVRRSTRTRAVVMLTPAVLLLLSICYAGASSYHRLHAVYGVQGRYLFPAVVAAATSLALALDLTPHLLTRAMPTIPVITQTMTLVVAIRHFWAPSTGALDTVLTRSVLPTWLLAVVALAGLAAATAATFAPTASTHGGLTSERALLPDDGRRRPLWTHAQTVGASSAAQLADRGTRLHRVGTEARHSASHDQDGTRRVTHAVRCDGP